MTRLRNLFSQWWSELPLIWKIWTGKYPTREKCNLSYLEKTVMSFLVFIRFFSLSNIKYLEPQTETERQTQIAEIYVVGSFVFLIVVLFLQPPWKLAPWLIVYRLIDGFNYQLCVLFVDRYSSEGRPRFSNGSLILLLIYYFELIVGFAGLFLYTGSVSSKQCVVSNSWDALYFSILTITTLGDEEFKVISGLGRVLVSAETILSVLFLVLVVSTFIDTKRSSRNTKAARS